MSERSQLRSNTMTYRFNLLDINIKCHHFFPSPQNTDTDTDLCKFVLDIRHAGQKNSADLRSDLPKLG